MLTGSSGPPRKVSSRNLLTLELDLNLSRSSDAARGFQPKSCTMHLIARMSTSNGRLLYVPILCLTTIVQNVLNKDFRTFRRSSLLSLFSSIAAHSAKNGMPPRRLASLFSPYIFGLADDQTFDVTYREWQKATDATEHIILAYVCFRFFLFVRLTVFLTTASTATCRSETNKPTGLFLLSSKNSS